MAVYEGFTLTWMIENFKLFSGKNGDFICSPPFKTKNLQNTIWYLQLYPRGDALIANGYVSCFLIRHCDNGPEYISIDFKLSLNGMVFKKEHSFKMRSAVGWKKMMKRKLLENHLTCVVECHMQISSSEVPAVVSAGKPNSYFLPCFFNTDFMTSDTMKETFCARKRKVDEIMKEHLPYSNQSFVRTRIYMERRIFTCSIKDYLYSGSQHKQHIPVTLSLATFHLELCMRVKDDSYVVEVEIFLENKRDSNCTLICRIELMDSERMTRDSAEVYIWDCSNRKNNWNFGHSFKVSDIKERKEASLRFTLTFSDGRHFSDIEWTTEKNNHIPIFPSNVSEDLHRLFTEKKFCDVTIRTKDKSFDAHKVVLCSRSPVFATMFESGMKECDTNVISINDLDSDTVSQMLHFMYTEMIEDLNAEKAAQLFTAADKYHIKSLKDICRNILKNNLTVQNICYVLFLADAHQDDDLSDSSKAFISYHKNDVLESKQWEEFEENNPRLALDTLKNVCMKLLP